MRQHEQSAAMFISDYTLGINTYSVWIFIIERHV